VRRRGVPVKINGDDIVFRARPEEYTIWARGVSQIGLKLSLGKTSVSSSWFSLNSTFFLSSGGRVSLVPVVRSTQWFSAVECPSAIAGRVSAFCRGFPDRGVWLSRLLRRLRPAIESTQRSLRRGLGVPVSASVIKDSGLWLREVFYLSLPQEPGLCAPRSTFAQRCVPDGWSRVATRRVSPADKDLESYLCQEMAALSWERQPLAPSVVSQMVWAACREGTVSFSSYLRDSKRRLRLLGPCRRRGCRGCRGNRALERWLLQASPEVRRFLERGRVTLVWRPEGFSTCRPGVGW